MSEAAPRAVERKIRFARYDPEAARVEAAGSPARAAASRTELRAAVGAGAAIALCDRLLAVLPEYDSARRFVADVRSWIAEYDCVTEKQGAALRRIAQRGGVPFDGPAPDPDDLRRIALVAPSGDDDGRVKHARASIERLVGSDVPIVVCTSAPDTMRCAGLVVLERPGGGLTRPGVQAVRAFMRAAKPVWAIRGDLSSVIRVAGVEAPSDQGRALGSAGRVVTLVELPDDGGAA